MLATLPPLPLHTNSNKRPGGFDEEEYEFDQSPWQVKRTKFSETLDEIKNSNLNSTCSPFSSTHTLRPIKRRIESETDVDCSSFDHQDSRVKYRRTNDVDVDCGSKSDTNMVGQCTNTTSKSDDINNLLPEGQSMFSRKEVECLLLSYQQKLEKSYMKLTESALDRQHSEFAEFVKHCVPHWKECSYIG